MNRKIFIFCALMPECRYIISQLKLKRDMSSAHFQVFLSPPGAECRKEHLSIILTITGTGTIKAAGALAETALRYNAGPDDIMVNIGTAAIGIPAVYPADKNASGPINTGDNNKNKGLRSGIDKAFMINKITRMATGREYIPDILYAHPYREAELYSSEVPVSCDMINKICSDINKQADNECREVIDGNDVSMSLKPHASPILFDMEAASLFETSSMYFKSDRIFFFKYATDTGTLKYGMSEEESISKIISDFLHNTRSYERFIDRILEFLITVSDTKMQAIEVFAENNTDKNNNYGHAGNYAEELFFASGSMMIRFDKLKVYAAASGTDIDRYINRLKGRKILPAKSRRDGKEALDELERMLINDSGSF
jgi:hypothetical protein